MLLLNRKQLTVSTQRSAVTTHDSRLTTHDSRSQRGFSLLEIVIALAIVTIGIVGVMIIFPAGLRASQRAADLTTAATLGSRQLQYTLALGHDNLPTVPGIRGGSFVDYPNWGWEETFIQPDPTVDLVQVTVTIYWTDGGESREKNFVTFMAD